MSPTFEVPIAAFQACFALRPVRVSALDAFDVFVVLACQLACVCVDVLARVDRTQQVVHWGDTGAGFGGTADNRVVSFAGGSVPAVPW